MPTHNSQQQFTTSDMVFGLLSIIDQFGTVLFERGKEYRQSQRGKELEKSISGLLREVDTGHKRGLDVIASSLDSLVRTITEYNSQFDSGNGHGAGGNGTKKNGVKKNKPRRPPN